MLMLNKIWSQTSHRRWESHRARNVKGGKEFGSPKIGALVYISIIYISPKRELFYALLFNVGTQRYACFRTWCYFTGGKSFTLYSRPHWLAAYGDERTQLCLNLVLLMQRECEDVESNGIGHSCSNDQEASSLLRLQWSSHWSRYLLIVFSAANSLELTANRLAIQYRANIMIYWHSEKLLITKLTQLTEKQQIMRKEKCDTTVSTPND